MRAERQGESRRTRICSQNGHMIIRQATTIQSSRMRHVETTSMIPLNAHRRRYLNIHSCAGSFLNTHRRFGPAMTLR